MYLGTIEASPAPFSILEHERCEEKLFPKSKEYFPRHLRFINLTNFSRVVGNAALNGLGRKVEELKLNQKLSYPSHGFFLHSTEFFAFFTFFIFLFLIFLL